MEDPLEGSLASAPDASAATSQNGHQDGSQSETGSGSGTDSGSESDTGPVLAVTRERRANAGSRMAQLLKLAGQEDAALQVAEGDEDDPDANLARIFAEDADDQEFDEGRDDEGDVDMSSSSDDEDAQEGDEEAGERELRKEKILERGKKRKTMSLLQQTMRLKKLKYAPVLQRSADTDTSKPESVSSAVAAESTKPAPRPKKKVERVTWLPDVAGTRSSMRKATVHNKQATHKRLKEHEKRRKQTIAQLQAAEDRRRAREAPPMTQAERLARAAEVERINLTSVNSWEAVEEQRQEERNAKLAALKNRKLDGPVITFWSGPALWINGQLRRVGRPRLVEEVDVESPIVDEEKADIDLDNNESPAQGDRNTPKPEAMQIDSGAPLHVEQPLVSSLVDAHVVAGPQTQALDAESMEVDPPAIIFQADDTQPTNQKPQAGFLDGIEYWASIPANSHNPEVLPELDPASHLTPTSTDAPHRVLLPITWQPMTLPSSAPTVLPPLSTQREIRLAEEQNKHLLAQLPDADDDDESGLHEIAARSLITLTSFPKLDQRSKRHDFSATTTGGDDNDSTAPPQPSGRWGARVSAAERERDALLRTLFSVPPDLSTLSISSGSQTAQSQHQHQQHGYDPLGPAGSQPRQTARYVAKNPRALHCAITGQVARYRDPVTGLPYASAAAYRSVRRVLGGQGAWSAVLQCWVGEVRPAKGVPESVWFGTPVPPSGGEESKVKLEDADGAAGVKADEMPEVIVLDA